MENRVDTLKLHQDTFRKTLKKHCILCQQTSPKCLFGNMTMTSNCDVTNSAHQIQMTTILPLNEIHSPP